MKLKIWSGVVLLGLVLGLLVCRNEEVLITPIDNPTLPARGYFMGVLPSPAQGQDFSAAYQQAAGYAEFAPVWGRPTPFYNLAADLQGDWGNTFVKGYIRGNGMFPLVHLSFIDAGVTLATPPGMSGATLSDSAWRAAYKKAVLDVVRAVKPRYLSLGNEVNRWYEKYGLDGVNGFRHYVTLYNEIYDAVKTLSPETEVFCTFAREMVAENREADLAVLSLFNPEKLDLLVFTSYPYALGWISPESVPDDYYARAAGYFPGKPFGFSEVAWSSLPALGGEEAQAAFLNQLVTRLTQDQGLNLKLLGWAWLHDLSAQDGNGLIKIDGSEKPAYQVWKQLSGR